MKNMNIVYPPLVEQAYQMMKQLNKNVSKQEIYKKLIEINMIDQQGNPTKWALDNGLVSEANTIEEARNKLNQINPQEIKDQVDADINSRKGLRTMKNTEPVKNIPITEDELITLIMNANSLTSGLDAIENIALNLAENNKDIEQIAGLIAGMKELADKNARMLSDIDF